MQLFSADPTISFFMHTISWKKTPTKVAYLWQFGFFFLCSPDCPKLPRTEYLFYRFFYPMICGTVFGESTYSKEKKYINSVDEWLWVEKCRNRTFRVDFLWQKSTEFFKLTFLVEKITPKSCILMAVWRFFSLQPRLPKTAKNWISIL